MLDVLKHVRMKVNVRLMSIQDDELLLKTLTEYLEILNPDYARKFAYQWAHSTEKQRKNVLQHIRTSGCNVKPLFDMTDNASIENFVRQTFGQFGKWLCKAVYPKEVAAKIDVILKNK